jgi:hypothetical protein
MESMLGQNSVGMHDNVDYHLRIREHGAPQKSSHFKLTFDDMQIIVINFNVQLMCTIWNLRFFGLSTIDYCGTIDY